MVALLLMLLMLMLVKMVLMVLVMVVVLDVEDAVDVDVLLVRVGRARPVQVEGMRARRDQVQGDREVVGVCENVNQRQKGSHSPC